MTIERPFAGLVRLRFPGMHLITALEGGVPLKNALAGHFWGEQHATHPHACMVEQTLLRRQSGMRRAIPREEEDGDRITSPGGTEELEMIWEEWSYIPEEAALPFLNMANAAIMFTQHWISAGLERPHETAEGPLVLRPDRPRSRHEHRRSSESGQRAQSYIATLAAEIGRPKTQRRG